jgi:hypothetical protein
MVGYKKFKHRDVVRIVKAAQAAGISVDRITVDPHTGEITVGAAAGAAATRNSWDEVLNAADQDRAS